MVCDIFCMLVLAARNLKTERLMDDAFIAGLRNSILRRLHGRLPSYCAWSAQDIEHESEYQRRRWFIDVVESQSLHYSPISCRYVRTLEHE